MTGPEDTGPPSRGARFAGSASRTVLFAAVFYPVGLAFYLNFLAPDGDSVAIDFVAFWSAAKLAVAGAAVTAFDWSTLVAQQALPSSAEGAYFGWHYPPTFHMVIAPLGLFGFTAAFAIYSAAAVTAYYFGLRPWGGKAPLARDLAIASPAVCAVVFTGNTSLLWAGAFLAAMHFLLRTRPAWAGAFIALLTLKPHLGVMIPIALLAGRQWRVILWATAFTVALAAVATAIFGIHYWRVFFALLSATGQTFAAEETLSRTMVTWYAFIRQHGGSNDTAMLVQIVFSLAAAASVGLLWSRRDGDADLKIAVLLLATLTATAYAFQYELVLAIVAVLMLARAGVGQTGAGRAWLALLWILPVPGRFIPGLEVADYAAPILGVSLAATVMLALRRPGAV